MIARTLLIGFVLPRSNCIQHGGPSYLVVNQRVAVLSSVAFAGVYVLL